MAGTGLYHTIGDQLCHCGSLCASTLLPQNCCAECVPTIPAFCRCGVWLRSAPLYTCVQGCSELRQAL
jgi:hypothetical protein